MFRFAIIERNKVTNIIIADTKEIAEEATKSLCIQSDIAKIDDTWDGINFISPLIELPEETPVE